MVTMRQLGDTDIKIIWWYVAALEGSDQEPGSPGEKGFTPGFFPVDEALNLLSFENDRSVLRKAISIVKT
jgi:hypothetical protein